MSVDIIQAAAAAVAITGAAAGITWGARTLWRTGKGIADLRDDLLGEPARPGVAARPGVFERQANAEELLAALYAEMHPNGGSTLRDAVNRCEIKLEGLDTRLSTLEARQQQQPVQVNVHTPEH